METESILAALDKANHLETFLVPTSAVAPGAVISRNLEWLSIFNDGRGAFTSGDYERAAKIFRDLDQKLPGQDKFLTPAKINETFCWLRQDHFTKYIQFYEPFVTQNRVYATVLWNLAIAYCRLGQLTPAESSLEKWFHSPTVRFITQAYLFKSALLYRQDKIDQAEKAFEQAWLFDKDSCVRAISRWLGNRTAETLLKVAPPLEPQAEVKRNIVAKEEVVSTLQRLLIPKSPGKSPQIAQQLSEFEYQSGYVPAIERFGDGDIDGCLNIIESLLKGSGDRDVLLWAKAACLVAKRQWESAIDLLENHLDVPTAPGALFWNATCAHFNLGNYESALNTVTKCTEREYRTSGLAWLAHGLLAHVCGESLGRNHAVKEAIKLSPKQLIYYVGVLRQIGVDLEGLLSQSDSPSLKLEEKELLTKHDEVAARAKLLLKQDKVLQAAQEYVSLSPSAIADIPEIGDTTFRPFILPTCPAELYDHRGLFLTGVAAYQRKAYEEAVHSFEDLYTKTDRSHSAVVNFSASLIRTERFTRAIDILQEATADAEVQDPHTIRNLISAFVKAERYSHAFPLFAALLEVSNKEFFNFVQVAHVGELLGKKEDVATALFNACTENLEAPSTQLKGAAVKACLAVKDFGRAKALVRYFVDDTPLPYILSGVTRPLMPARNCTSYAAMQRQYEKFHTRRDARAALAYFHEVQLARESDYGISSGVGTVVALFNAYTFYAQSLFSNKQFEKGYDILGQAYALLTELSKSDKRKDISKRFFMLARLYMDQRHYFWAKELCERGLEANTGDSGLLSLSEEIKKRIKSIPEGSREAIKELGELPLTTLEAAADFKKLLPKISQLVEILQDDFPDSRKIISRLGDVASDLLRLDSVPIVERKKEIIKHREAAARIERDMPLHLPKTYITALLPVLRGIRKALDEVQANSVCPEFVLSLEPVTYYRENEASLVCNLRNVGSADILKLRLKMESPLPQEWAPVLEEQYFDTMKKDGLLWIDWPIHLDLLPTSEVAIRPIVSVTFTGGSLRGEMVSQVFDTQETKLQPYVDISVEYPVVAMTPQENKLYGRENLLRTLKNSFTALGQTRIPFLEGVRKVGKTSIFYFLAARLPESFLAVYVNLDVTWTNPYQLLAKRISDELNIRLSVEWEDHKLVVSRDDFNRFLASVMRRTGVTHIVFLLDEFHAVIDRIESNALPSEFLGDLRDIYQNRQQKVSVAFADWYRIEELNRRVPAQLWTDFAREPVSFLNDVDTREAVQSPAQGSPLRFERQVISRIYYWTNGYPWHIQWICAELINHLDIQKRYVAIPQDVDLIVQRLLKEDRLFRQGVCRSERITRNSQTMIYGLLEEIKSTNGDICLWFDRDTVQRMSVAFDLKSEVTRLEYLDILQEQNGQFRFCSPLHALWFESMRSRGVDIHGEVDAGIIESEIPQFTIPEDPTTELRQKCDYLKELKSQLRRALVNATQIFKNLEMPAEWADAALVVQTQKSWDLFIGAMRDLFVEDMISRLDSWEDRKKYVELNRQLHSIRERRNFVEHIHSAQGRIEEERCRLEDIRKRIPTSPTDWLRLQIGVLDRTKSALEACLNELSRK